MSYTRITELPELPARPADSHKGTFGRVLVVAGSRGMSGAAALAGLGALRGGAGLVYVAAPLGILPIVASIEPSYLTIPLEEDVHGRLRGSDVKQILEKARECDAIALGPGIGLTEGIVSLVDTVYREVDKPLVVDADGLNAIARASSGFPEAPGDAPRVLTPHPGEFARLIDGAPPVTVQERIDGALKFAAKVNAVVVLKGHGTLITDGERLAVNETGNSGMATGGTGDVLTGLIAALLGQGMEAFEAAQLGAHLHGLAGDLAADDLSRRALIASDVAHYIGEAWQVFESENV